MVKTYSLKKDGQTRLQPNFQVYEFACADGSDEIMIDDELVALLQRLRDCMGLSSLKVVCGYRTQAYNDTLKRSSKNSQHLKGKAADVRAKKNGETLHPKYLCCAAEVLGVDGIGLIETCAHIDTRGYQSWFDENKDNTGIKKFGHKSFFTYCGVEDLDFMENPFEMPNETLKKGDTGEGVKWLQFELIKKGFLDLISEEGTCNIDGSYGGRTEKAVNEYLGEENAVLNFGEALEALKHGKKVARSGWNGKGMFLFLAKDIEFTTDADLSCVADLTGELTLPSIVMKTADNHFCVGWLASQTDMLAEDWIIIE